MTRKQAALAAAAAVILIVSARGTNAQLRRVLFFGDSITANPMVTALDQYPSIAARLVGRVLPQNLGVPGGRMTDVAGLWPGWAHYPDVVEALSGIFGVHAIVVLIGTNDWGANQSAASVEEAYRTFLDNLPPRVPVICVTPPWQRNDGTRNTADETLDDVRAAITRACTERGLVVRGDYAIPHDGDFYKDAIHPNALGNLYLARAVARALKKVL